MICQSRQNKTLKTFRKHLKINFPLLIQLVRSSYKSLSQVWARTSSWTGPLHLQGVRKGERRQSQNRVGWEGGAALERAWAWMLHWGLVFWWKTVAELGQLQQQWQQERPRTRPDHGERKSSEGGRDEQPWGSRTLTHSHFCERISQTEEEGKTVNNKELD